MKASYHTLGCKLNFAETSAVGRILEARGVARAGEGEIPDICVVNTCAVTSMAEKKCRTLVRHLASAYPDAVIAVTGCYAQLRPAELAAIEGVDVVLGTDEKLRAADFIDRFIASRRQVVEVTPAKEIAGFNPSCERGDRTRYFLKVQDGCDYFCSYCTIPYARGRSRSATIAEIAEMARKAADEGAKEIILTGVNIGDFGKRNGEDFFSLVRELDRIEPISRYRISSIEPDLLSEDLIKWVGRESRAFMPHFHIPLQAGTDEVLRIMGRRYGTDLFRSRIELIREYIPDAFIGVDVIAGSRGETDELWRKSHAFIESLDVTRLHVFPYSERPGTRALQLGGAVDNGEKHRRVAQLTELSERKLAEFTRSQIGKCRDVLWERRRGDGMSHGLTDNYLRVAMKDDSVQVNTISRVRLDAACGDTIIASPCDD